MQIFMQFFIEFFMQFLLVYFIIFIIVYIITYKIQQRKRYIYNLAKKRANETDKLLMVIGDPLNGSFFHRYFIHKILGPPYEYGDVCIDLSGCPENSGYSIKAPLEDIIYKFHTNSYVIYISQTLEYIDSKKIYDVLKELIRVSNKDLFIVNMTYNHDSYNDRTGTFIRKTYFTKTPPEYNVIEYYYLDNKYKKHIIYLDDKY